MTADGRLADLSIDWLRQYAGETTLPDPSEGADAVRPRLGQLDGYLTTTAVALAWFGPSIGSVNPIAEAGASMARIEAEFAGRLLVDRDDLARFDLEPADALTWAVAAIRHADALLAIDGGLSAVLRLVDRGVRALAFDHPATPDDRRIAAIDALIGHLRDEGGPALMLDLSGLTPDAAVATLDRIVSNSGIGLVPITRSETPPTEVADRVRRVGGLVGVPIVGGAAGGLGRLDASIRALVAGSLTGVDGLAIASGFLEHDLADDLPGTAEAILGWLDDRFDPDSARRLAFGNVRNLIGQIIGGARAEEFHAESRSRRVNPSFNIQDI